jgi:hypothetical protein
VGFPGLRSTPELFASSGKEAFGEGWTAVVSALVSAGGFLAFVVLLVLRAVKAFGGVGLLLSVLSSALVGFPAVVL